MADIPFLGCKISLISKCDIRYEGILYCVDPKESTIALSKVKSYGTETRGDPSNFVAPKNDVYDIIIFRAADVKDLRVDAPEPPGLSDPAIISARQSNAAFDSINNGSLPTSSGPSHQQQPQHQHQHAHQQQQQTKPLLPFLPTGSNGNKDQQSQPTIDYSTVVANAQRRTRPDPTKRSEHDSSNNKKSDAPNARDGPRREPRVSDGDRRDDRRPERRDDRRQEDRRNDRRGDDRRNYERRDHNDGGRRGDGNRQTRVGRGGYDRNQVFSNTRYNNNGNYNSRRGQNNRDENSKGGPAYRRGPIQGGRRGRSGDRTGAPRGQRRGPPLKFEGEYDFDEANKLFLELDGKFKDMKLKDGEVKEGGEVSGDRTNSKSPAGPSESGSGYDSEDQNNKDGDSKDDGSVNGEFYDKTKSFFDNISCEASERSQGKVNKDWRKERQLNVETFGVSTSYRRGGYRGRPFGANGYHRR